MQFEEPFLNTYFSHVAHADVHNIPAFGKNLDGVVSVLQEDMVTIPMKSREHASFAFKEVLLQKYSPKNLKKNNILIPKITTIPVTTVIRTYEN